MIENQQNEASYREQQYNPDHHPNSSYPESTQYRGDYRGAGFGMSRRHDVGEWGNPSFTQNTSNRQYDRINENAQRNTRRRETSHMSDFGYGNERADDYVDRTGRHGQGQHGSNWNQQDRYNWNEQDRNWDNQDRSSGIRDRQWENQNGGYYGDRTWDRREDESYRWERETPQYRGTGPKGYRRSDDRIKEDINDRLTDDHRLDASGIEVSVEKTEVTLTGTVRDREGKRRAEYLAESVSGVTNVENRLRVNRTSTAEPSGSDSGAERTRRKSVTNGHPAEFER
jgi:osmotically-inducible protein OsmY